MMHLALLQAQQREKAEESFVRLTEREMYFETVQRERERKDSENSKRH